MRHCFRFGQRFADPVQVLDPGPIDLPGGGTLFIVSATYERASDYSAIRERLGDDEIFVVHFEVNDPMPGGHATFRVRSSRSGPVTNEFGATVTAYVRAPSNTSGRLPDE